MKKLTSKMIIKSNINNIKEVMNWINADLKPLFAVSEKFESLRLTLQEAITNAIVHGNNSDDKKSVEITYKINESVEVTIKDEGKGVSSQCQEPDINTIKPTDIFKESGRGIMLMKHFCDEIKFYDNHVIIKMQYK